MTEIANNVRELPSADPEVMVFEIEKAEVSERLTPLINQQITGWVQDSKVKVIKYPLDLGTLLQATTMGPFHKRCLVFKRIAAIGSGYDTAGSAQAVANVLPTWDLRAMADDWLVFGNGYLEKETNVTGRVVRLHHVRANTLWKTPDGSWTQRLVDPVKDTPTWRAIPRNKIIHLREYSPLSDHYGVPDYIPALLPVALAYEADDFHRKFYQNGAHAGLIILLKGVRNLTPAQRDEIKAQLGKTKGPGNFKSLFMCFKNSDVDIEIKGVAKESPVKDDYAEVNKNTREKIISAHGVPPRLMNIILDAKAGAMAGQVEEEMRLFNLSWAEPAQLTLEEFLNPWLPAPIKFKPFLLSRTDQVDGGEDGNDKNEEGGELQNTP